MIDPSAVSAVLVTRGDVPMDQLIETIEQAGIDDIVVWDNSQQEHDSVCYGRWLGCYQANRDFIYIQDDDLLAPVDKLLTHYDPVRDRFSVLSNNRIDEEWPLLGIGSVFHKDLVDCFTPYIDRHGIDSDFLRACDVIFGYSHPYRRVVLGYTNLPWQTAPNSMYLQDDHMAVRWRVRDRVFAL